MSEKINVEHAFDPEARQAQADLDNYINSRPYKDELGNIHNPENGSFINAENYFNEQRNTFEQDSIPEAYENMSMSQLAKKLASAEFENDKTKAEDISDALMEKLSAEEDRIASEKDRKHNEVRSENLWNKVMGIKDRELAKLSDDDNKHAKSDKDKKSTEVKDDLFTYNDQEELNNKDEAVAEKASESEVVSDDEVFEGGESVAPTPERQHKETVGDIVNRIAQRRFDGDWDEDAEKADLEKINQIVDNGINKQLDDQGITDPEERRRRFNKNKDKANQTILRLIDKANRALRDNESEDGEVLRKDLDNIPDDIEGEDDQLSPTEVVPEANKSQTKERWFARNKKKVAGALLALAGVGAFFGTGSQHEDRGFDLDIGNHGKNIEKIVDIDETDNKLGEVDVSKEARAEIAGNFDKAEQFFKAISTKKGLAEFQNFTKQFEANVQANMKTHNLNRHDAETLTNAEFQQYFANHEVSKLTK